MAADDRFLADVRPIDVESRPAEARDAAVDAAEPPQQTAILPPAPVATPARSLRLRAIAAIGVAAIAVVAAIAWKLRAPPAHAVPSPPQSLAVLPFENLTHDPAQDYFADGMTDELITSLGRIRALHVISRTSAMSYKGAHRKLAEIARELGVDTVVEGSVLHAGNRVHSDLFDANLAFVYAIAGRRDEAKAILSSLESRADRGPGADSNIALVHVGLGEPDAAMASLERAFAARFNPSILLRPGFDALRGDPRFKDLRRRIGLPAP